MIDAMLKVRGGIEHGVMILGPREGQGDREERTLILAGADFHQ
jgi:hypothetical protein